MRPVVWIGGIVVVAFAGAFAAWLKGFFTQFLLPPQRTWSAIANAFKSRAPLPRQRFRLVLCWLENDGAGRDTSTVEEAFTGVEGIELVRSARALSRPWPPSPRRSRSVPVRGCPSTRP